MAKGRLFPLAFSLLFASGALLVFIGEQTPGVLAGETTSYTQSVTLLPEDFPTSLSHDPVTLHKGGLAIIIGEDVSNQEGWICFNSKNSGVQFPSIVTRSGPHGIGYSQLIFGPAESGNFSYDVVRRGYALGDTSTAYDHQATLSTSQLTSVEVNSSHPDYVFAYSCCTDYLSTRVAYLSVTYRCQSA